MQQLAIFDRERRIQREHIERMGELPVDFTLVPDFVASDEEQELLHAIDASQWSAALARRVQHYGYRYDYRARAVSEVDRVGPLPEWAQHLAKRLAGYEYFTKPPDQVIVNEYQPGQGINPHTDRTTCFGPVVASLSLGSDIIMDFSDGIGKKGAIVLPERSLLVLSGSARAEWRHGIASRHKDKINSTTFERRRRVSLTFRSVILS